MENLEGAIQDLELKLVDNGKYEIYTKFIEYTKALGNENFFDHFRYMLALSNSFNQSGGKDQYMYVGGLGVLGNILRHVDSEKIIGYKKEMHDIDIILRSRPFEYVLASLFNNIDECGYSLSFPNKFTVSGSSIDSEGKLMRKIHIDAYIPNGHPKNGAQINGTPFNYMQWEARKETTFLGIPFYVANPMTLLKLKLGITTEKDGARKTKDCKDIFSLLGVLEKDSCTPKDLYDSIKFETDKDKVSYLEKIKKICSPECRICKECGRNKLKSLIEPSENFIISMLQEEEKEKQNEKK